MSLQGCFWICFLLYAKIRAGGCQLFWYRHMHLYIWYVISVFSTVVIVDFQVWHTCILASHLAGKYFLTITYWRDSLSTKSYSLLFHSSPSLLLMSPWHPHIVNPKICVHLHAKPDIDLVVGFDVFCPLAIARWSQIDSFFFWVETIEQSEQLSSLTSQVGLYNKRKWLQRSWKTWKIEVGSLRIAFWERCWNVK